MGSTVEHIRYEPPRQVHLFGGTALIWRLAERLSRMHEVVVWTSPRQIVDAPIPNGSGAYAVFVHEDINNHFSPEMAVGALGIGLGEAWQFGPEIRAAFGNRLIDFMSIPYPNYLGGAHISHAIMRGERRWGCCMQLVTENTKQGEVHDGAVLYSDEDMYFPEQAAHETLEDRYFAFLIHFFALVDSCYKFHPLTSKLITSFFPRLNTVKQGWIDWSWKQFEIIRFIKAFDAPYPGARTTCRGETVILRDPVDCYGAGLFHPFHAGLITSRIENRIFVQASGGMVSAIVDESWVQPGMRLYTSQAQLDAAMLYEPNYTPTGDSNV